MSHVARLLRGLGALNTALPQTSLSRGAPRLYSQLSGRHLQPSVATHLPKPNNTRTIIPLIGFRYNSSASNSNPSRPLTDRPENAATDAENAEQNRQRREQEPAYQLTFTCKPCGSRSTHRVSKHGYHRGTVLIRCPGCENRHVISDNLKIFFEQSKTLDDLLEERGQSITTGELRGDLEFWGDGTMNVTGVENGGKSE
ncbi:DNL-type zinc finger protein [Aspergillus undulatus]|uniref:DNL-type zinc finger protein n=1 Tax=Aspergillus undulatus TaxID=1810928 RepID=UPI003CCCA691